MEYIIKDGLSVCHKGFVIIETIEHYVKEGYVFCNPNLNGRSWNTTEKKEECKICNQFRESKVIQLTLF